MRDVEDNRLSFRAPDEGEAARGVDGKAARALAAVRPPRGDGARTKIDGERRVVPRVGIRAMARQIDLQRLGPVRHFDIAGRLELRRRLLREAERLDRLRPRFAHPHLAQRRDPANVVGRTAQLHARDDAQGGGVDDDQHLLGPIGREDERVSVVGGGRPL